MMDTKIAITRLDDSVTIMTFLIVGRGSVLPFGAEWADKAEGEWMREASVENVNDEIRRAIPEGVAGWRIIDKADIPTDRTYRNALRDRAGKLEHDMMAARELHREMIRHARARRFLDVDGEWMRETGQGNKMAADAIEAVRQQLRDAPADPAIETARTTDELKATWPEALLGPMKEA